MQLKSVLPEEGSGNLRMQRRDFDWHKFWLLEVVFLAVPMLVTVLAKGGRSPVSPRGVAVLLVVLVALTVVNLFLGIPRGSGWMRRYRRRGTIAGGS